jgi:hypothetical protein
MLGAPAAASSATAAAARAAQRRGAAAPSPSSSSSSSSRGRLLVTNVAVPSRPPTAHPARRSKVEIIKEQSDYLRHPLMEVRSSCLEESLFFFCCVFLPLVATPRHRRPPSQSRQLCARADPSCRASRPQGRIGAAAPPSRNEKQPPAAAAVPPARSSPLTPRSSRNPQPQTTPTGARQRQPLHLRGGHAAHEVPRLVHAGASLRPVAA